MLKSIRKWQELEEKEDCEELAKVMIYFFYSFRKLKNKKVLADK